MIKALSRQRSIDKLAKVTNLEENEDHEEKSQLELSMFVLKPHTQF